MTARLKWEETDGSYLLAMLHTTLDQQTAQSLYPFILNSHPSLDSLFHWSFRSFTCQSLCLSHTGYIPFFGHFSFLNIPSSNLYFISQTPISLPSDSSALSYFLPFYSLCLLLCLSAICSAWRECLALEETGVSLCVRNLTAQITWHNETWQVTAAVQKLTVESGRHLK